MIIVFSIYSGCLYSYAKLQFGELCNYSDVILTVILYVCRPVFQKVHVHTGKRTQYDYLLSHCGFFSFVHKILSNT